VDPRHHDVFAARLDIDAGGLACAFTLYRPVGRDIDQMLSAALRPRRRGVWEYLDHL
jgi:hypothetical protein